MAAKAQHALAGLLLQKGKCPECGGTVNVKANKNGTAYFYCGNIDGETFGRCNHQTRYSPKLSAKLCAAYFKSNNMENPHDKPANENRAPIKLVSTRPEPKREQQPPAEPEPETNFFGLT